MTMCLFKSARRLIIFLALIVLGQLSMPSGAPADRRGGRIVVAQFGGPRGFNRLLLNDQETSVICDTLMATLMVINRQTQRVEPALAERWELSPDGLVLTLYLRKNVRFSDGHPFTADDVLFTCTVALDDKVHSLVRDLLTIDGKKVQVEKIDSYTVRMTYPQRLGVADRLLDEIVILPRHILEPHYKKGTLATAWDLSAAPQSVVGLGPFRLKQYVAGQRTIVERNPYYWKRDAQGRALPYLDELVFEIIPDKNAQQLKFQRGQLDILKPLVGQQVAALREQERKGEIKIHNVGPGMINDILWFNQNAAKKPRTDKPGIEPYRLGWFRTLAFRQAVSYAIDRSAIINIVFGGYASPSWGPITPGNRNWYNTRLPHYTYNLEKARSLLQGAGFTYKNGRLYDAQGHPVEFVLITTAGNEIRQKMSALIQQDLSKLGMKVTLASFDSRALLSKVQETYDYDACLFSTISGDADPSAEMEILLSRGHMHWWNPQQTQPATPWEARIDTLMFDQLHTLDPAQRRNLFDEVQAIMAEQQAFIFLVARHLIVATKSGLSNVKPAVMNDFVLWNCEELYWKE